MSRISTSVLVVSTLALMACSPPQDASSGSATPQSSLVLSQECENHPLLPAMPSPVDIGGKALTAVECASYSIQMIWGDAGSSTSIGIVDSQGPLGDVPPSLAQMVEMGRSLPLQAANTALALTDGVAQAAMSAPAALAELGGPDYLPIVKERGNLRYTIEVQPKDNGGRVGSLTGTVKDRYAVTMNIESDSIIGLAAGEAAYNPWLSAMKLDQLP